MEVLSPKSTGSPGNSLDVKNLKPKLIPIITVSDFFSHFCFMLTYNMIDVLVLRFSDFTNKVKFLHNNGGRGRVQLDNNVSFFQIKGIKKTTISNDDYLLSLLVE